MRAIRFVDTTLRDGSASLWANRLDIDGMLPAMPDIDAAGYDGVEFYAMSMPVRLLKEHGQDPWDWIRLGVPRAPHTTLRMHGSEIDRSFGHQPTAIRELLLERVAAYGLRTTRMSDPWNDPRSIKHRQDRLNDFGIKAVVNLIYSISPRHTTDYYRDRVREIAALRPYRICFKDVGGLLTPERVRELVPGLLQEAGNIPVEFHAHGNNGLAPLCALTAAELGVTILHTAIPPLANGTSQPSIFRMVENLKLRGFEPEIDVEPLRRVSQHLHEVARVHGFPVGAPLEYDEAVYATQIPGAMISHLRFQLQGLRAEERLPEVLEEAGRVRADLGYPIMVTPLAQFVGSQAVMNVLGGKRYGTVTDEVILYTLGRWGEEATDVMDPDVRSSILDRPRTAELQAFEEPEPSLEELRKRIGNVSDDGFVMRFYVGDDISKPLAVTRKRDYTTTYEAYHRYSDPVSVLARRIAGHPTLRKLSMRTGDMSLRIERTS